MRVTTTALFDRPASLMGKLSQQADLLQTQIATTKRIGAPSDDPAAYKRLEALKLADANDETFATNVKLAQGLLAQTDSTLESIETQLQRAQEITLQAANGPSSDADRKSAAATLDALMDELLALANTRDSRGQPLFGGADGATPYARDATTGVTSYVGVGVATAMPVGGGASVTATVSGDAAFGITTADGPSDMFAVLKALSDALKAGGAGVGEATDAALEGLQASLDQVGDTRAAMGARAVRMDLAAERLESAALAREETRSALEDTDIPTAIAELQKTLTVLQATQASFSKLTSLSLFDYLR